ncbi:hypothetical protein [Novosphingobium sp. FKTRR1]|nr:hypothetical protein [Novosphingobium sp. FKTRR1]
MTITAMAMQPSSPDQSLADGPRYAAPFPRARPVRRWLARLALLIVLVVAGFGYAYREPVQGLSQTAASYAARVGCSCRFVGGRPLGDCRKDLEGATAWATLSEDDTARSVTASYLFLSRQTATYREGYGCVLETWPEEGRSPSPKE